jgi:lipid II:glycine glycyltransferase (peptidoglycan interpeptide bridge formation enzyme)|tara:strand:- start:74 stop:1051 length:978 start_codon:yes stop_codon:yes gene_type:complete
LSFKLISPDREQWNSFVDNNMHSSVFQRHEIADMYNKTKNMEGIRIAVSDDNEILACMAVKLESKGFLKRFTSLSIIENAPLYQDSEKGREAAEFLIKHYNKSTTALYTNVKIDNDLFLEKIYESEGYNKSECLNYEIGLEKNTEAVFKKIHKSRRKNIKRAEKKGVKIIEAGKDSLPQFYGLLRETYSKLQIQIPDISYFNAAFSLMPGNVKLFFAIYQGNLIGARLILLYKKKIFDWFAGASSKHLGLFPNDALVWHVLEYGCKNSYELFDFGGAGIPDEEYGVREFKKRFGGQLINYNSFKKIHKLFITKLGSFILSISKKK